MTELTAPTLTDLAALAPTFARAWLAMLLPLLLWAVLPRAAAVAIATALAVATAVLRGPVSPDGVGAVAILAEGAAGLALGVAASVPLIAMRAAGDWLSSAAAWPRLHLWLDLAAVALWLAASGPDALMSGVVTSYTATSASSLGASAVAMIAVAVQMAAPLLFAISALWIALAVGQRALGSASNLVPWLRATVVVVIAVGLAHAIAVMRLWIGGTA